MNEQPTRGGAQGPLEAIVRGDAVSRVKERMQRLAEMHRDTAAQLDGKNDVLAIVQRARAEELEGALRMFDEEGT